MKRSKLLALLLALMVSIAIQAQDVVASGVVRDASGEPIIGASVVQVGNTAVGAITDYDGNFRLTVARGSKLQVSYVGFVPQTVTAQEGLAITLLEDASTLDDVVVIGYGVQKKSVVTAAIAKVSSDDLAGKGIVRMDNALKGLAAGVNVTSNSGQPGEGSRVRVRGIGTINNSDPLYIVDGMPIGGGFDFVNPNDIESIEVLKDAASGAIYGARAANGVILVTTKKGKEGKATVNYNGSYGWQSAWRHRDVTSATDYAILQNERSLNGGGGVIYADPYNLLDSNGNPIKGFGTDWQKLVFNDNAPVQNHDVSVSGATESLNYYLSLGYYEQEGIVGGNYGQSNYDRLTLRSNTNYTVFDHSELRSFLNKVTVGANLSYLRTHSTGIATNSEFGSVLGSALYLAPTLAPVALGSVADAMRENYSAYDLLSDAEGNPYTIPGFRGAYQEINNPLAMMQLNPTRGWAHKFVANFSAEVSIWDNLKYRISYSEDLSFWGNEGATLSKYYLSGNNQAQHTEASMYKANDSRWQIENILSYDKTIGKHTFGAVLGQSALKYQGNDLSGNRWNLVNINKPYMNYTNANVVNKYDEDGNINGAEVQYGVGGGIWTEHRMSSLFARANYDYDNRYMVQATVRRDGSSKFGPNKRYGVFPSFSLGWNIARENFMESTSSWLDNFKLRFSWGKNGNDNIDNHAYTSLTAMGNNVLFGKDAQKWTGSKATRVANPYLHWEESEQTDLGIDLGFFGNALTFTADYFVKKTNGMIIEMPIPSYVGESKPLGNVGDMKNSGFEFELGYKWNIRDAKFSIKGNAAYLKNELVNLGNSEGFLNLDGIQGYTGTVTRAENGLPFPFFYGYKTDGIFQNWNEINAYAKDGKLIQPNARPGDVRFVDMNGDGQIDDSDRTNIGNGTPDWTFGFNFTAAWKGFDLNVFLQGVAGADVFDGTYRNDIYSGNYPSWMLGRWCGEGTSNKVPLLRSGDTDNWKVSDLYVFDGSYLRLKNISLGYTLPQKFTSRAGISMLRFYVMAENLFTWTKYRGFDPEIGNGGTSLGVDKGIYPQARTITVGVNLSLSGSTKKAKKDIVYTKPETQYIEKVVEKVVEKPVEKIVTKEVVKEVVKEVPATVQATNCVVTFAAGSYQILNTSELDAIGRGQSAEVVAYSSPEGPADVNMALSEKRAAAVADYLKSRGVNVTRVEAKGADSQHANRIAIVTVK